MKSIQDINLKYLCTGCGACAAVCPTGAIKMKIHNGVYRPEIDQKLCIGCGRCLSVCPGIGVATEFIPKTKHYKKNHFLGSFISTYLGYSKNESIRFNSSSGGIATALLVFMIKNHYIDGAVVTRIKKGTYETESFIAKNEEELISAQGSKYSPTNPVSIIKKVKNMKGKKFAFVGLPCHIHGIRKIQKIEKWAQNRIILTIGLFCSHGSSYIATKTILEKLGRKNSINNLKYRGNGWPGKMEIGYKDKKEFIPLGVYWKRFYAPYFFTPYRCLTCCDFASELADISLGDAWLEEIKKRDNIGTSVIITRSRLAEKVIKDAEEANKIYLKPIPYSKVIKSQSGILLRKKVGVGSRIKLFKLLHRPTPNYNHNYGFTCEGILGALLVLFNVLVSKTFLGKFLIKNLPKTIINRYCNIVYKLSSR